MERAMSTAASPQPFIHGVKNTSSKKWRNKTVKASFKNATVFFPQRRRKSLVLPIRLIDRQKKSELKIVSSETRRKSVENDKLETCRRSLDEDKLESLLVENRRTSMAPVMYKKNKKSENDNHLESDLSIVVGNESDLFDLTLPLSPTSSVSMTMCSAFPTPAPSAVQSPEKKTKFFDSVEKVTSLFETTECSLEDEALFVEARENVRKRKFLQIDSEGQPVFLPGPRPSRIQLGDKEYSTHFSSLYPDHFAKCKCLYLCEFCLCYMTTVDDLKAHYEKCTWHSPAGRILYRDKTEFPVGKTKIFREFLVYEIDGQFWTDYCKRLCLLGKFFLQDKLLVYDVELFLFYVVCYRDQFGDHLMGYFSKEKISYPRPWNLNCVAVLPPYQGEGWGKFLISFSYLLSRVNGKPGTPERPVSEQGQRTYRSCWKMLLSEFFFNRNKENQQGKSFLGLKKTVSIEEIADKTGIWAQDVAGMLREMGILVRISDLKKWTLNVNAEILQNGEFDFVRRGIFVQKEKLIFRPLL